MTRGVELDPGRQIAARAVGCLQPGAAGRTA
jgi:hypothetical protein